MNLFYITVNEIYSNSKHNYIELGVPNQVR